MREKSYNEQLLDDSLLGNKVSLKELEANAGSGNAEAQYYLAEYYSAMKDENSYAYWMEKAANNGYEAALEKKIAVDNDASNEMEEDNSHIVEGLVWIVAGVLLTALTSGMYLFYGVVLYGLYKLLFGKRNN